MTSASLSGTINTDQSVFNIVGGNQVNHHIYPPLASGTSNPSHHHNNAPLDLLSTHFTGRRNELAFLQTALSKSHSDAPSRCAVHGMPGLGKTQLLLRYAKLSWDHQMYTYIFWISATSVDKINQGISGILDLIEHPDRYLQDQTAKLTAARVWLEKSYADEGRSWLLVFDNVHRESLGFLRVHLPLSNGRGNILFSTRTEDVAESLVNAGGERYPIVGLQAMELRETANLLFEDAGIDAGTVTSSLLDQAEELVERVGRLPLAVAQLASLMKQTHTSIDDMLELYKKERKIEVIKWENDLTPYEARSVAEMFTSQFDELNHQSHNIGNLLKLLSFLDPENIPVKIIVDGAKARLRQQAEQAQAPSHPNRTILQKIREWRTRKNGHTSEADDIAASSHISPEFDSLISLIVSPIEFQTAIQKLQNLSLVEHRSHNGTSSLWIHDLIRFMVQEDVKKEGTYDEWLRLSWSLVYDVFSLIEDPKLPQSWADCEKLVPHLQSLMDAWHDIRGINTEMTRANSGIAEYFRSRGRYDEAEILLKQVFEANEKNLGANHPDTLMSMDDLGSVKWSLRQYDAAEVLHKRALDGCERYLGVNHPFTISSMNNLARVYSLQERLDEAEVLHKRVLKRNEKDLGPNDPRTLASMNNLADVYSRQRRYDEAEELHKQVLEAREKHLGIDNPHTLTSMSNLASVYSSQRRYEEAEVLHKRALEGREKHLGTNHPRTLASMNNLADVYSSQGRYDEARVLHERLLERCEKHLGSNHPNTLTSMNNLACVYLSQKRYEEAETLHKRTLEGRKKHLGTNHPRTLASMNNLASVYSSQSRYDEARILLERSLEGFEKHLGANHPDTIKSMKKLARVYSLQGRDKEAGVLRRKHSAGQPPNASS